MCCTEFKPKDSGNELIQKIGPQVRIHETREPGPTATVTDCRDAADNKYLDLALAAQASAIVSSDQDLLVLHPWRGILIQRPADYLVPF